MNDRRLDSPVGRSRDHPSFLESRKEAIKEEKEAAEVAAKGTSVDFNDDAKQQQQQQQEELPAPLSPVASRRASAMSARNSSMSPGSPGAVALTSLLSPNLTGMGLYDDSKGDNAMHYASRKVVLRDDYKGDFVEDKKHGRGRMRYADGSVYYGDWVRDQRHGYGEYYYANGDKYCGHWQDDLMHTPLIVKHTDADQGLYIWANGDHYKGGFARGRKYGEGRKDYVDGSIEQGHWEHDVFEGYVILLVFLLFLLLVMLSYRSIAACLPAYLPACLPACLSACLPVCLPVCLPAFSDTTRHESNHHLPPSFDH
jgi:hypothetical protein